LFIPKFALCDKKMKNLLLSALLMLVHIHTQAQYAVTPFATGFSLPVGIENCGDSRLFVLQKRGLIRIVNPSGTINPTPFLNLTSIVSPSGNERGLLGLAFHPKYKENGYFYVNYTTTASPGATHVSRFQVDPNDSNLALPNSELLLLEIAQPYTNHNGGNLEFGPDGYLYIGMGDGGSANDPQNRSQDLQTLLGKMLRIDVDNPQAPNNYGIPADNPVFAGGAKPEIWSYGLRNPWKFSFDKHTGDMWIGDVGQNAWEEIDFEALGTQGGRNYGWRCYEGNVTTAGVPQTGCPAFNTTTAPVFVYGHSGGNCSVTGGVVYRGAQFSAMYGKYLCIDYCTGILWEVAPNGTGGFTGTQVLTLSTGGGFVAFGEDMHNEVYLADDAAGIVYRLSNPSQCNPVAYIYGNDTALVCNGASAVLQAQSSANLNYQWFQGNTPIPGATQAQFSTPNTGTYKVVVTNPANGCSDTTSVVVDEIIVLNPNVQPNGNTTFCQGGSVVLNYSGSLPFEWNTGETTSSITADTSGDYSITVFYSDFCSSTSIPVTVVVNPNPATPSFSGLDSSYCFNNPVSSILTGVPAGGTFSGPGVNGNVFDPAQAGIGTHSITYTFTDANNCSSGNTISTIVDVCSMLTTLFATTNMVFPNPSEGIFFLNSSSSENTTVRVFDMQGRLVWMQANITARNGRTEIDLRQLNQGTYMLELNAGLKTIISIQH
jgi:glucose/arabinose dehydrogenase